MSLRNTVGLTALAIGAWVLDGPFMTQYRDVLPEPVDIMDHVGNIPNSMGIGITCAFGFAALNSRIANRGGNYAVGRKTAAAAGLVIGGVVNALWETKFGQSLPTFFGTVDELDFVYGTTAAVISSAYALKPASQR
jgi:hypothetical protein